MPDKEIRCVFGSSLKNLQSGLIVTNYALYNTFFYTQLVSVFVPPEDFYYVHDDTDPMFLFLLQLNFDIFHWPFFAFFLLLFRKILIFFTCFFLEPFSVFLTIFICHFLYIEKKCIKEYFISSFCKLM